MNCIVTGAAGFIGFHLSKRLLALGYNVLGIDNLNNYYSARLKEDRNKILLKSRNYAFCQADIADIAHLEGRFRDFCPRVVFHLAAQAGVRYSIDCPSEYVTSNLQGFLNILECCRHFSVDHLIYASSSSVYGANKTSPFSENHRTDEPISFYGATKKANEVMAYSYSHLYGLPASGLRFFTVYGPWGRPDMAYFLFAKAILEDQPIKVFNNGELKRDFTYIDDVVEGIIRVAANKPVAAELGVAHRVYNIGNGTPVELGNFIAEIECALGKKAQKVSYPMQAGDMKETYADVQKLMIDTGYCPITPLNVGITRFIEWYVSYYGHGNSRGGDKNQ